MYICNVISGCGFEPSRSPAAGRRRRRPYDIFQYELYVYL